jgi:hypothetical protein
VIKHLSDAATSEFLFIIDFFKTNSQETFNKSVTQLSSVPLLLLTLFSPLLLSIFKRTLSHVLENLENYLLSTYDTIGILLIIKVSLISSFHHDLP